jgi:hypothetical protein
MRARVLIVGTPYIFNCFFTFSNFHLYWRKQTNKGEEILSLAFKYLRGVLHTASLNQNWNSQKLFGGKVCIFLQKGARFGPLFVRLFNICVSQQRVHLGNRCLVSLGQPSLACNVEREPEGVRVHA